MRELFGSKKFKVALAAVMGAISGGIAGVITWEKVIMLCVAAGIAYVTAQGAADIGKEKAKEEKG